LVRLFDQELENRHFMSKIPAWFEAQKTETDFWKGIIQEDHATLRVLADNSEKAPAIRKILPRIPETALEVGVGPLGLGIIGFLPEIPHRFGVDPQPPVGLGPSGVSTLRDFVRTKRLPVSYATACGEEIPIRSDSMDLVICCNVIDHASDPSAILREVHRVLKPNGLFFFDVHTFSVFGLLKWHSYTKHARKDEILVIAHPYRMYEADVARKMRATGFRVQKLDGHTRASNLLGHARTSTFLGTKCLP
jgi:SAM-dependent methyltransferase